MIWTVTKAAYRSYHGAMKVSTAVTPFPVPDQLTGEGSTQELPRVVKSRDIDRVLVVTDKGLTALGLVDGLCRALEESKVAYTVFDEGAAQAEALYQRPVCGPEFFSARKTGREHKS